MEKTIITTSDNSGPPCNVVNDIPYEMNSIPNNWNEIFLKKNCYVLTFDKSSFKSLLALGINEKEKQETKFIFVEKVGDFNQGVGKLKIMNDFYMNPNMNEILKFLEEKLVFDSKYFDSKYIEIETPVYIGSGPTSHKRTIF